ncbi:hypothetical protein D5H75_22615 [Bailinhaonella thermotolerans]|uniref:Uncharacterized protein n=1 Tax=Bailinhaonella thermotolerans TaxID=1070861 RepID=A0A3A4AX12_9ACTN|nr:hypothetical protein D5H75_22615 [Bailinhaonella thermotolerans]
MALRTAAPPLPVAEAGHADGDAAFEQACVEAFQAEAPRLDRELECPAERTRAQRVLQLGPQGVAST